MGKALRLVAEVGPGKLLAARVWLLLSPCPKILC